MTKSALTAEAVATISKGKYSVIFLTLGYSLTHLYPGGPLAHLTFSDLGNKPALLEQFWMIKTAAAEAALTAGWTITHHHTVGRDHRRWYDQERPEPLPWL